MFTVQTRMGGDGPWGSVGAAANLEAAKDGAAWFAAHHGGGRVVDQDGQVVHEAPCPTPPADTIPLSYTARQVLQTEGGPLLFVPLTPAQLEVAVDALGSHAGRLVDAESDGWGPFAELQGYLHRFAQEAPHAR